MMLWMCWYMLILKKIRACSELKKPLTRQDVHSLFDNYNED
jgi:hypothetical protein